MNAGKHDYEHCSNCTISRCSTQPKCALRQLHNSSIVISEIHQMLLEVIEEQTAEVYLIVDNHSMNNDSIVLAYLDYLASHFQFSFFIATNLNYIYYR